MTDILIVGSHPHNPAYRAQHASIIDLASKQAGFSRKKVRRINLWDKAPINDDTARLFTKRMALKKQIKAILPTVKEKDFKQWFANPKKFPPEVLATLPSLQYGLFGTKGAITDQQAIPNLKEAILQANPTVILALGPEVLWALTGYPGIMDYRGVALPCTLVPNRKILATYHPETIRKNWALRFVLTQDFRRAYAETSTPHIRTKTRTILIPDTVEEVEEFINQHCLTTHGIAIDVETAKRQITVFCLSPSPTLTMVVPIWNEEEEDYCHWNAEDEYNVWLQLNRVLGGKVPVIMQNCLYDISYFCDNGLLTTAPVYDTMLWHHALQPEVPKSLGFLASLYIPDVGVWKPLGNFSKNKKTVKSYE